MKLYRLIKLLTELVKIMDAQGFTAMCEAANKCPACILAALRVRNMPADAEGPGRVAGPEDGRNEWSYAQAKTQWWAEWNSAQAEREGPSFEEEEESCSGLFGCGT